MKSTSKHQGLFIPWRSTKCQWTVLRQLGQMRDEKLQRIQLQIRWTAGLGASCVLVYLSVLSVRENYTLETPVIIGMLSLIIILMYGADALTSLVESWKS